MSEESKPMPRKVEIVRKLLEPLHTGGPTPVLSEKDKFRHAVAEFFVELIPHLRRTCYHIGSVEVVSIESLAKAIAAVNQTKSEFHGD